MARGTTIETPSGPVLVESLETGDLVWGFDVERNEPVVARVLSISRSTVNQTVQVGSLRVTKDCRLVVGGHSRPAGELKAQEPLLGSDLKAMPAGRVEPVSGRVDVFDVTVDGPQSFFAGGVLVDNGEQPAR